MGLDTKIYWLTNRQSQCDFDLESVESAVEDDWEELAAGAEIGLRVPGLAVGRWSGSRVNSVESWKSGS
jgi:hypothetical protein